MYNIGGEIDFKSSTWVSCILCFWLWSLLPSNYVCTVISNNISFWWKILESADNIIFFVIVHFESAFISYQVTRNRKRIVTIIFTAVSMLFTNRFFLAGDSVSNLSELHCCFHQQHLYHYLQRSSYYHFLHYFQHLHHQYHQPKVTIIVFYVKE